MNRRLPPHVLNSILVLSASIGITACSGQSFPGSQLLGGQQQASYVAPVLKPLKKITEATSATKLWQVNTGTAVSHVKIHPYANDVAVFVATGSSVTAWNKTSGASVWKQSLGEHITGGVNGGDGSVFVGTTSGKAVALDVKTGAIQWIIDVETEVLAVSKTSLGVVVIRTIDGKLHGLNSKNGEVLWQRVQRTPELSLYGASAPVIVGNGVIAGFDNGVVAAYGLKTGKPIWEIKLSTPKTGSEADKLVDIDGRLKTLGNALFTTNSNGRIVGINMVDGTAGWTRTFSSHTGAEANTKGVYSTDEKGSVWKLSPTNGQQIWQQDALQNRQPTTPTLTQDGSHIIVADKQGNLHWIATQDGKITNRISGDPSGYNTPALNSNGTMFILGRSGVLTAIKSN